MSIVIREWTGGDLPSVRHIAWTTWLATYASFIPERDIREFFDTYYTLDKLEEFCNLSSARGFIAEVDAVPAGFAKTNYDSGEKKFYLNSLYVLPEYQGKGIGGQLLHYAESFALSLNAGEVWLGVMTQNVTSVEWYERIGFQFVKEEPFTMGKTTVQHRIGFRAIHR